jgi:hypothetical protein
MTTSSNNSHELANLEWQAFRYVAGEMSLEESTQFERLLADGLAACEAVTRVTELSLSVRTILENQSASPVRALPAQPSRAARWGATVAAFAALSLLIAIISAPNLSDSTEDGKVSVADRDRERSQSEQILSHWMTPASNSGEDSIEELEPLAEEALLVSFDLEAEAAQIPDWMFDAVRLEPREPGHEIMDESGSQVQEN